MGELLYSWKGLLLCDESGALLLGGGNMAITLQRISIHKYI